MMRDITIGQYYPADSIIHRLDPRVKLFAVLIYIISVFSFRGIAGLLLLTLFLAGCIFLSKVPFSYMVRGLKTIMVLLCITGLFNLFGTRTGTLLWQFGILHITDTGLKNAVLMVIRLSYLIMGTSLMTLTTTPNQLTDGLENALATLI